MNHSYANVIEADLSRADHQEATVQLLEVYSKDPMGDGRPLSETARREVIAGLRAHPTTMIFLAYDGPEPVGFAICFRGFSTFAARPLLNIHDFYVVPAHRGAGLGRRILAAVEEGARARGCCKLTLEVQENNRRAQGIYTAAGFAPMTYVPEAGRSLNLSKNL